MRRPSISASVTLMPFSYSRVLREAFHDKARRCANAADRLDSLVIDRRPSARVLGDVAEESMLDLVPLRGAGRKVADADCQAGPVGERLQLELPQSAARAVAAPFHHCRRRAEPDQGERSRLTDTERTGPTKSVLR